MKFVDTEQMTEGLGRGKRLVEFSHDLGMTQTLPSMWGNSGNSTEPDVTQPDLNIQHHTPSQKGRFFCC